MKFGCNQQGPCSFKFLVAFQSRYQPAKLIVSRPADAMYYRLSNGDILNMESKTILNRDALLKMLH